jgi:hypothetical protein
LTVRRQCVFLPVHHRGLVPRCRAYLHLLARMASISPVPGQGPPP